MWILNTLSVKYHRYLTDNARGQYFDLGQHNS